MLVVSIGFIKHFYQLTFGLGFSSRSSVSKLQKLSLGLVYTERQRARA